MQKIFTSSHSDVDKIRDWHWTVILTIIISHQISLNIRNSKTAYQTETLLHQYITPTPQRFMGIIPYGTCTEK